MTAQTKAVDVPAVLQELADLHSACTAIDPDFRGPSSEDVAAAITAFGELFEAAQDVVDGTVNASPYPDGPCIDRRERDRLIAALARAAGGAQ